ncbi:NADH dehydrogenase subunit I [Sporotomaculum syntrophicum]|uniref:NADH dehydrogenase subunit I n=1 Tax=Sporotomaculum syntrophicum TaxID=182264 RepID=A0A9D3AZU3_9FIRM|nr:4Fe-4S binding protein [Sporotomaculum syntrophicum]KAF1086218.1 NADH dehydrogenase subunit I [Sporotomaculum syntrophicum]
MGHMAGKDIYRRLGEKIDNLTIKSPWNKALHMVLKELYSEPEADLVVQMPYQLSSVDRIAGITGVESAELQDSLKAMAEKGLVLDLYHEGQYYYMPSPLMVGIFEFTMMRTGSNYSPKAAAELFHAYLSGTDDFYRANAGDGQQIALTRVMPYPETVAPEDVVEILPYEKVEAIVESHDQYAIGTCACRHEKQHIGQKTCATPLDTCTSFGYAADYLIRHHMAAQVSREQVLENLMRCKELGLVFCADNVRKNITFICCCCSCCCNMLQGINKFGYTGFIKTSSFIATVAVEKCTGCGRCVSACPVNGINLVKRASFGAVEENTIARVDETICLGCGVCATQCARGALQLIKRQPIVLPPETIFERNILACLEKGTLQNYLFDNPGAVTHQVMRGVLGGILRLSPVKKALVGDLFCSVFIKTLTTGVKLTGRGWITEL